MMRIQVITIHVQEVIPMIVPVIVITLCTFAITVELRTSVIYTLVSTVETASVLFFNMHAEVTCAISLL
jgi:hypothetical protein